MGMDLRRPAWMLGVFAMACGAAGCGGGGSASSGDGSLEVTAEAFQLAGTETATLDLTQRDVVLAAALASLTAATNLRGVDYLVLDSGTPEPGGGRGSCDGGEVIEDAEDGIGVRDVLVETFQCYFAGVDDESVVNGSVHLFKISSAGGHIEGDVEPGVNGRPLVAAFRDAGDVPFVFIQADALVDYEGDADEDQSSTVGARLLFGDGTLGSSDRVSFRKGIELFAGPGGTPFQTQTTLLSEVLEQVSPTGTLIYRGEGMDAPCNVTGRFAVATTNAVTVDFSEDGRAIGGSLALTSGSANATVAFQSNGDAVVTTSNGSTTTVASADVDTHCGFD